MKNELFHIGPLTVYGYGTMMAFAILAAVITVMLRGKRKKADTDTVLSLAIVCAVSGLLSAKLMFLITEWRYFIRDPFLYLTDFTDGFVVFGGIIGGTMAGFLYCRIRRLPFLKYFDLVMPSIALAQAIGRIGCFLAGCCYGRETHGVCAVVFRDSAFAPNHVPLIPTQLYSAGLNFLNFMILLLIDRKQKSDGMVAACYLIFYSGGRFVMEFFRGDLERGNIGVLSTSQFIAVFTFAAGLFMAIYRIRKPSVKIDNK